MIFDNLDYEELAADLIQDAFYSNQSYRGKISRERSYAELVLRKLLDIDPEKQITIKQSDVLTLIRALPDSGYIIKAIDGIQPDGNNNTHTQFRGEVNEEDYNRVTDSLFDLIAGLFINYFSKYSFGSDNKVMRAFSLLPPIIRYKVLNYLYVKHPDDVDIIDRLALVIVKNSGKEDAYEWIKNNEEKLKNTIAVSNTYVEELKKTIGDIRTDEFVKKQPNMYEVCIDKINLVANSIERQGVMYKTFEEALPYYRKNGILPDDKQEYREFNSIMQFLYLGRKEYNVTKSFDEPRLLINLIQLEKK